MSDNGILSEDERARCAAISQRIPGEIARIVRAVCDETGIRPAEIYAPTRGLDHVAQARQLIMFIAKRRGFSLNQIGRPLRRHHTTVLHGVRAEEARMAKNV